MTTLKLPLELVKLSSELQADGYPFEAIILSGEPIDGWHRFIVDLATVKYHKPRLTVNYNHNDSMIIGYGENFEVTPEGLKSTGKLAAGSFADELVSLAKQGVPFEASVEIELNNAIETRVGADASITVNGRTYTGPISVYRDVPLRAYGICPCGADKFTHLTLLQKERALTMPKQQPPPKTTNLSDDSASGESQEPKVKDPDLAEFIDVYGTEKGLELWQSGADIGDIRQLKELIDKYGVPGPPDSEPTELNETPPADDPPKDESAKEEEKETTELKAVVTALKAEITKLHAALPRGEQEPVKHSFQTEKPSKELSPKEEYLQGFNKKFQKV